MKLKTNDSSLSYYNRLIDKGIHLNERLKLAESLWDLDDSTHVQSNKQQLIIDWIIDLLINKKRYSFTDNEFNEVLERLNYFLAHSKFKNTPINGGLPFVQVLFEAFTSSNKSLVQSVHECCFKLFKTKFSHYFTRNIDQMTRIVTYFIVDLNEQLTSRESSEKSLEDSLGRVYLILQKYFLCLKSQQNQNRLFNRMCSQIFFNLLNLIENLKRCENGTECIGLAWTILKYALFSKPHSNIYNDFFKNLPTSFSAKSNYQVAVLFNTIQTEAAKSTANLRSICRMVHIIAKEIFTITNSIEYRQKIQMIQFLVDLMWQLHDTTQNDMSHSDLIIESLANLMSIVEELSLFNKIDDVNNQNIFKTWSRELLTQTFKCRFNNVYAKFLIKFLHIDHLILDADLDLILGNLKNENNLKDFLNIYLECSVKFRQLSRAVHMLINALKANTNLTLPFAFYETFSESLENYNVDSQTVIFLWKDLNKFLSESNESQLSIELLKFLNSLISRVNLTNQRLPSHLKTQAIEQLDDTNELIKAYLFKEDQLDDNNELVVHYLDCFYTSGLVYLMLYRYSITSTTHLTSTSANPNPIIHSKVYLEQLNAWLTDLNVTFHLNSKIHALTKSARNFRVLFYLNKLQLINVFTSNLIKSSNEGVSELINVLDGFQMTPNSRTDLVEKFHTDQMISSANDYANLHLKLLIIDNFYMLLPLIRSDPLLIQKYFRAILQHILVNALEEVVIDKVNLNTLFNDNTLVKPLLLTFLSLLVEGTDDSKNVKFLDKIIELVNSDGNEELTVSLFESKKYTKVFFNPIESSHILKLATNIPIEFVDTKHALIFYFLAEKIPESTQTNTKKLEIYFRLFATMKLFEMMPMKRVETWLIDLLTCMSESTVNLANNIFDKLVKKCVKKLLIDDSFDCLKSFVDHMIEKITEANLNVDFLSFGHLALIQVLENISKIQEFTMTLNKNTENIIKLNDIFNKILNYFIELNGRANEIENSEEEAAKKYFSEFKETHLFYICQILMRRICSSVESINQGNTTQFEYFQVLMKTCLKTHKEKMKIIEAESMEIDSDDERQKKFISTFHIDFIKSCIHHSATLSSKHDSLKIKPIKMCKSLINLLYDLDDNYKFNTYFLNKLTSTDPAASFQNILIKSLALSLNTFTLDENTFILNYFEEQVMVLGHSKSYERNLSRLVEFMWYVTCEMDMNETSKIVFSEFVQKLLIQMQPIYLRMKSAGQFNDLINLLTYQTRIVASKYIFVSLDLNQISLNEFVDVQELVCKTLNNILVRYSKKFGKISAVVCNILTKLISKTTNMANQNNLDEATLPVAIKAAQDLERFITRLTSFKKEFSKIAPYMISEYVCIANTMPINPAVKNILVSAMYNLISICDIYGISQLHVVLPVGARELFKTTYAEYEKYFKYTGKT